MQPRNHEAYTPKCNHEDTKTRNLYGFSSCFRGQLLSVGYAFRLEKKWASTKVSMTAWLAGSTFSNWMPMPTRRSLQATRPSASISRFDPGMRKRTLTFEALSRGLVVRIAMPPWLRFNVRAAAIVLPKRY